MRVERMVEARERFRQVRVHEPRVRRLVLGRVSPRGRGERERRARVQREVDLRATELGEDRFR